jgi:hypothetical protein
MSCTISGAAMSPSGCAASEFCEGRSVTSAKVSVHHLIALQKSTCGNRLKTVTIIPGGFVKW